MKRSATPVLFVVGRRVFVAGQAAADFATAESRSDVIAAELEKAGSRGGRLIVVWEPVGFTHSRVDCPPKVDRRTFASLAEIAREHVSVVSDTLGWGFETPKPEGSSVRTWLHAENTPELNATCLALADAGWQVTSAWSLATLALRLLSEGKASVGQMVVCAPPFVGVFCERGRGVTRPICASYNLDDDPSRAALFEALSDGGMLDSRQRTSWAVVGSDRDLEEVGNKLGSEGGADAIAWREGLFGAQRRDWPELERIALKQSGGSTANLMDSFPVPFPLGKLLRAGAMVLVMCAVLFAGLWFWQNRSSAAEMEQSLALVTSLKKDEQEYSRNKAEIQRLRATFGGGQVVDLPKGRILALRAMANAVPDAFSISRFTLSSDNAVDVQFIRVNETGQLENLSREWQRAGFVWNEETGDKPETENHDEINVRSAWTRSPGASPAKQEAR